MSVTMYFCVAKLAHRHFFCFPDGSTKVRFAETYVEIIEEDLDERSSENDDPSNGEEPRFIEILHVSNISRVSDFGPSRISRVGKRQFDRFPFCWVFVKLPPKKN